LISVIFQNGIIAVPSEPPKPLEQYKEQLHIQRLEIAVQKLTDENENFKRQLDDVMESKVALYANIEDIIASQNDKIASQNDKIASRIDKIASLSGKIDIMREDMILSEQRETMQDNLLKSKIDETAASVEEMKNTPKAVVAFRVTCAKNFPYMMSMYHSDKQVIWQNIEYNIGSAYDASNGKFTCPYDGIYSFYATSPIYGQDSSGRVEGNIDIMVNQSVKSNHFLRNSGNGHPNYGEENHVSPQGLFKLKKGDTVHISMSGYFYYGSSDCTRTYFQGHLIDLL